MDNYQADRAVEKRSEDLLGRVPFAEAIADALVSWRENASLVVGLTGEWGTGKTSIKNFIVDALAPEEEPKRADIVQIAPWELSGTHDIEAHFFTEIERFLTRKNAPSEDRQIAHRWRVAAAALGIGEALTQPLAQPISTSVVAIGLATMGIGALAPERGGWVLLGALIALLGHLLTASKTVAERVSAFFETRNSRVPKSTGEQKKELAGLLRQRTLPLVIVIDEIDRLSAEEIRLIFRLVKANCDLPRMLYLLVFDRAAVARALERDGFVSGEAFLEKIIQAPFDVPAVQRPLLNSVLVQRRNDILERLPPGHFAEARWLDVFHQRLWIYFRTLRDVYRFLSAFEFHAGVFQQRSSMEVNVVDLFILEVFRIFEPALYRALPSEKTLLTRGSMHPYDSSSRDSDEAKKRLKALVALAAADRQSIVGEILAELFPRTAWAFGGTGYHSDFDVRWTREKRVCTGTHFDKYFYIAVPAGDIAQSEIDEFVSGTGDAQSVRSALQRFEADGRIVRFLERLQAEIERIPRENGVVFLTALFDVADALPEKVGILGSSGSDLVSYLSYHYIRRAGDHAKREQLLAAVIRRTTSLYAITRRVAWEEPDDKEADRDYLISRDAYPHFMDLCVGRLRSAAESGELLSQPKCSFLLHWWRDWASLDEVQRWCAETIADPIKAVEFTFRFIHHSTSQGFGSVVAWQHAYLDLKALEQFVDLSMLESSVNAADFDTLNESEKFGVKLLRDAMARRRSGKPDRGPRAGEQYDDDDEDEAV